jgi:hypothetical protein
LAVEERCDCDFTAAKFLGDLLESELLRGLGIEERFRVERQSIDDGRL